MALTFELKSPQDVLAKVRRELAIPEAAAASQDKQRIADALYNFSVTAYHVKDWLREHPGVSKKFRVKAVLADGRRIDVLQAAQRGR